MADIIPALFLYFCRNLFIDGDGGFINNPVVDLDPKISRQDDPFDKWIAMHSSKLDLPALRVHTSGPLTHPDVVIEYATVADTAYNGTTPPNYRKMLYLDRKESPTIETNGALTIMQRTNTRAETFTIEAINNFDARPRQTITVDVADRPLMSGVVQSITWALPSARMSVELRDLEEV